MHSLLPHLPGHEQYTRNMATAASVSDLALVLVDARNGITNQTRRHSLIAGQFGIRHAILAVNKCDLVGYAEDVFQIISDDYRKLSYSLGIANVLAIPVSALHGDNVTDKEQPYSVVRRADPTRLPGNRRCRGGQDQQKLPHERAMGLSTQRRVSRVRGHGGERLSAARRCHRGCGIWGAIARSAHYGRQE